MKYLLRTLVAVAAALWLAVPTVSNTGGENAGGTGVWVLPGPQGGPPGGTGGGGRMGATSHLLSDLSKDCTMVVDASLGNNVVATVVVPSSGVLVPLSVSGRNVTLRSSEIQGFIAANVHSFDIVIAGEATNGYRIRFNLAANGRSATMTVR